MADVGAWHYWFVPVRLFMKDKFRSDLRAGKVTAPVLVVHGAADIVILAPEPRPQRNGSSPSLGGVHAIV